MESALTGRRPVEISTADVNGVSSGKSNIILFPVKRRQTTRANLLARSETKPAESLRSYDEIIRLSNHYISKRQYRNNALFITGLSTGFRISDLVRLRVKDIVDVNTREFVRAIDIWEKKTGKRTVSSIDEVLVTDAMKNAVREYLDAVHWRLSSNDYLFKSRKRNSAGEYRLDESQGYRIITDAAKEVGLMEHVGSHTLRRTFLNIANAVGSTSKLQGSTTVMTDCQILARHSNIETTLKYMTLTKQRLLSLREGVSAFLLGRTVIKNLEVRYEFELEDGEDD